MNIIKDKKAIYFRDAKEAFNNAISINVLSADPKSFRYAGLFMYMHSVDNKDLFKNINTRQYIEVERK
jgi:hypothetical protein